MKIAAPAHPVFLGFSVHASIQMELLLDAGFQGNVDILRNVPVDETEYPYSVEGIHSTLMDLDDYKPSGDESYYLSVVKPSVKELVYNEACRKLDPKPEQFPSLIHSSCQIASTVEIEAGTHIEQGVIISSYASIGMGVNIKRGGNIGHHSRIDDFATFNPGVTIASSCHIGKGVVLGVGTTVFDNVEIGEGSIIGGGSVVNKSIPAGVIAFGNPCKVIRQIQ